MTWRSHRLALEIERPLELEVKHRFAASIDPNTGLASEHLTVLHLAADRGVFVTHRVFGPDHDQKRNYWRRHQNA
ncbi:hypothetical protein [Asaia platycodi]|uniref:hypothetical protein n=1 Tax=Asaia platycodi TaxID=610243 RepID=UPI0011DD2638|nr:hypothetical protein [Asaia platycodi]